MKYPLSRTIIVFTALLSLPAKADVGFRASAQASAASGTTVNITVTNGNLAQATACGNITPPIPAGNVGDLLIAQVTSRENGAVITMPGWNTLYSDNVAGEEYQVVLFYRSATNTAADTNTINQATSCNLIMARITRFGNVDTAQPLELDIGEPPLTGNDAYTNAGDVDTGSQDINLANSMLVLTTFNVDNRNVTQPGTFTELYDDDINVGRTAGMSLNYRIETATGTQGPFTAMDLSGGGGDPNHGVLLAVRPAPSTNTLTINVPAGTVSGDAMLASIAVRPSGVGVNAPSGWTSIRQVQQPAVNSSDLTTYYRIAGASEPASYTWTFAASHTGAVGGISSYTGVETSAPIDAEAGTPTASNVSHAAPDITTAIDGSMLVTTHSFTSAETWSPPPGMTETVDIASQATPNAGGISLEINYEARPSAGATGARTATAPANADTGATQSVALRAIPPPSAPGICEDFESGLGSWIVDTSGGGDAGINGDSFNSPGNSLFTRWSAVSVTSNIVDYQGETTGRVTLWIQRGSDTFSNTPEAGENLVVEYFNDSSAWVALETFAGGGTAGEVFTRAYTLPADALHAGFRLRFRQTGGSGSDFDYWHVDDICFQAGLDVTAAYYDMEELAWNGTAGEVTDSGGNNLNGQAINGAFTANTNPAIAGNPGTCRYGVFDGNDDHLQVADNALLDIGSELTVAAWMKPDALPAALMTILSKDENFELHLTNTGQINWWWQNSGGTARQITTTGTAIDPAFGWQHVAIVYSQAAGSQTIYINGAARATANFSEALINNADPLQIGADQGAAGRYFDGQIDEVYIYNRALSASDISTLMNQTHSCAGTIRAYYAMEQSSWSGIPGEIADSSGNGNHGNRVGTVNTATATPAINTDPGTCRYGTVLENNALATFSAVDTTLTPGASGAITFWYRSNTAWNVENQMLLDASANLGGDGADKHFFLTKRNNGDLQFRIEDSADTPSTADTGNFGYGANTWVHIGITWDLAGDRLEIYVDGAFEVASNINLDGTAGAWNSLYIGDNRTTGVGNDGGEYFGDSVNGLIDEVRIYDGPVSQAVIQADMDATHPCNANHFRISHDGTAVTCQSEPVTIIAHMVDHSVNASYTGTLTLSTSTNRGDWTVVSGNGAVNNGAANDGAATYNMVASDSGDVILGLKHTPIAALPDAPPVNIGVTDGTITESTGTATAAEDPVLSFYESGFIFLADTVQSAIGNQIAGKASNVNPGAQTLELQAVRTNPVSGACEAALSGNVNIELAFECEDPDSCASQVAINGSPVSGNAAGPITAYTPVSLDFGDITDSTATFTLNYPDSGQIQLHARYNMPLDDGSSTASGNYMIGASNSFVVRPFGLHVAAAGNPAASSAADLPYTRAGAPFTANVTAAQWQAADDADNDGFPDGYGDTDPSNNANLADNPATPNFGQESTAETVTLSSVLILPSPGADPGLSGTTSVAAFAGGAGSTSVRFDEVGIIELAANLGDADFLGTGNVLGRSTFVGRFIPDHFSLNSGNVTHRLNESCVTASPFTYMDEIFQLDFGLIAERVGGGTTQNYHGAFAKLDLNTIGNLNLGAVDTVGSEDFTGTRLTLGASAGAWTNGVANNVTATALFEREAAPDGPYPSLTLGAAPVETDGTFTIALGSFNLDVNLDTTFDHAQIAVVPVRYGRMFLENAFGSELLQLTIPLYAEYYSGTQFTLNTDDNCTDYDSAALEFSNEAGLPPILSSDGLGTLINGRYDTDPLTLPNFPPISLDAPGAGVTGSICNSLTVPAYLRFNWAAIPGLTCLDGDGDPSARTTFGIFGGPEDNQIYIREVY